LTAQPVRNRYKAVREQINIEPETRSLEVDEFFIGCQQIDQERCEARVIQHVGHVFIPRTMSAAAAAMGENHNGRAFFRNMEVTLNFGATDRYVNQTRINIHVRLL
jgi:hypothetical protein